MSNITQSPSSKSHCKNSYLSLFPIISGGFSYLIPFIVRSLPSTSCPSLKKTLKKRLFHRCEPLTHAIPSFIFQGCNGNQRTHIVPSISK